MTVKYMIVERTSEDLNYDTIYSFVEKAGEWSECSEDEYETLKKRVSYVSRKSGYYTSLGAFIRMSGFNWDNIVLVTKKPEGSFEDLWRKVDAEIKKEEEKLKKKAEAAEKRKESAKKAAETRKRKKLEELKKELGEE